MFIDCGLQSYTVVGAVVLMCIPLYAHRVLSLALESRGRERIRRARFAHTLAQIEHMDVVETLVQSHGDKIFVEKNQF